MIEISSIKEKNASNLYSFYTNLGIKSGFASGSISSARYISDESISWPSHILGGGKMVKSSLMEVFKQMQEGRLPYFWLRTLEDDPEFEDFAGEYGIRKINFWKGMYLQKDTPFRIPPPHAGLMFEELKTPHELKDWLQVVNQEILTNRELSISIFLKVLDDPDFRFFRVRNGKKTVSTLLMHKGKSEAGIYLVSTALSERRRGYGRWITASAIDLFISGGCNTFVLHATPLGYPLYLGLGFEECCDYGIFWMHGKNS